MISSTPRISPKNFVRKSIFDTAAGASPLIRRRSQLPVHPRIAEVTIDDESERRRRRSHVDIQRRVSNIPAVDSPVPSSPRGEQEIRDHFQICIKMFAENKINVKNAWNLRIIDYMRNVIQAQGLSKDSLQVATTSLDVSAKVYGLRVDDIHAHGLKLASSMARVVQKAGPEGEGDDGDIPEGEDKDKENEAPKRKKKQRRLSAGQKLTVARDPKTLEADVPKLESIFFQTHNNPDLSAIENLFTNKLQMNHAKDKFYLLAKEKAWATYGNLGEISEETNMKPCPLNPITDNDLTICAPFTDFDLDVWDPEQEEHLMPPDKPTLNDEVVYDDQGIPIPELDGSVPNLFDGIENNENDLGSSEDEENADGIIIRENDVEQVVDFRPVSALGAAPSDYSYNSVLSSHTNKFIVQIWAGPSHWKLKHIRRAVSRFSGHTEKQVGKTSKKAKTQPTLVNFDDTKEPLKIVYYKSKRNPVSYDISRYTLPQNLCIFLNDKMCLMNKPSVMIQRKKTNEDVEYEVSPYNYENPNDSQYCAQIGAEDEDDGNDHDDFASQNEDNVHEEIVARQENFMGENLVDAPDLVPKTYIPYALQAKKMDMKKLKAAAWDCLTEKSKDDELGARKSSDECEVKETLFSAVYEELPNRISEKMRKELSCPLAFVALLHLANEHNLGLTGHEDLKDFKISQSKP